MDYQTFTPQLDLEALISCYWTLKIPADPAAEKQCIVPDGTIEMAFILGDDIQRFTNTKDFILQPRAMVLGPTVDPFYIQPTGRVDTFAIRFYPYGFANFTNVALKSLANKETPLEQIFDKTKAGVLEQNIIQASSTAQRISIVENFLLEILKEQATIDTIVKSTVELLISSKGGRPIHTILKDVAGNRRQLERKFAQQIGLSPKQLSKVIRLQTALKLLLTPTPDSLTNIAYASDYYDQSHFIKDFKEFTGTNPNAFLEDKSLSLSALFYQQ